MPLPDLVYGLLPQGGHDASLAEVNKVFVTDAMTYPGERRDIWNTYLLWSRWVEDRIGAGVAWLAGTFVSGLDAVPRLRVAYFPRDRDQTARLIDDGAECVSLFGLEDVFYLRPETGGALSYLPPVGGMLDSTLHHPADEGPVAVMWSVGLVDRTGSVADTDVGYVRLEVG